MRFAAASRVGSSFGFVGVLFAMGWTVVASPVAGAQETTIMATVCRVGATASLAVISPQPHTITPTMPIAITLQTEQVGQIAVYVDGNYSETVPVDRRAPTFRYDFRAPPGTHTVRFEGQDLCARTTPVGELTVTYDPRQPVEPITGQATTGLGAPSVSEGPDAPHQAQVTEESSEVALPLAQPLKAVGDAVYGALVALDIVQPQGSEPLRPALQFSVMTTGLALVVAAGAVVKFGALIVPHAAKSSAISLLPAAVLQHPVMILRGVGVALVVIAALFFS